MSGRASRTVALTVGLLIASAASASGASVPGKATSSGRLTAAAGQSVTIFANKDFKVTGTCEDNGGGDLRANTFLSAKRNNLDYTTYGPATGVDKFSEDFDKADGKIDFTASDATGTDPLLNEAEYYEFYAEGSNGRPLRGHVATSVHVHGADCGFGGEFVGPAKKGPLKVARRTKVAAGKSKPIFQNKDFKVIGSCVDNGGGDLHANALLQAKRSHLTYYATSLDTFDTDFGPADGKIDIFDDSQEADGTAPDFRGDSYYEDVYGLGRGGKVFQARIGTAVHWRGGDCSFSGTVVDGRGGRGLTVVNVKKVGTSGTVTLFKNADFKVTGTCVDNGAGDLTADTQLSARRPNLAFAAYDGLVSSDIDFNPAGGPADITQDEAGGTAPDFRSVDQYTDFWGEAAHGGGLSGRVGAGVHMLGADCVFTGIFAG
jgi:hypothetical protein